MIKLNKEVLLKISDFEQLIDENASIDIDENVIKAVENNYNYLKEYASDKIIYGINTGLGPMAQYKIDDDKRKELQINLIRSHAAGMGPAISDENILTSLLIRLKCLSQGYSGVHKTVILNLQQLINHRIIPFIPEHGGVGASGDLVQLAHLALVLIGEGKVKFQGNWEETKKVFQKLDISPIEIKIREGLALINGTSIMTGIGVNNIIHTKNIINWSLSTSILLNEIVNSYDDNISAELNELKLHYGQNIVAKVMRDTLNSSKLIKKRNDELYSNSENGSFKITRKVQEYYSLRCVPQILGPIYDTLLNAEKVILSEANSVSDNPIVHEESDFVFHGGNFHGDYVSFEMDKLKLAVTKLSMLMERQLNFLVNHRLNKILPPFVNLGTLGLNLGMQGAQFTAVSTTAENQALSNSLYIHSIPNNNDNQDIVSMGANSSLICQKVIENTYQVLTVKIMALMQAVDYLGVQSKLCDHSKQIYEDIRSVFPSFNEDYPIYEDMGKVQERIMSKKINLL